MAETKIAERIISGTGVLRLPPSESAVRYYSLLVDVIRLPIDINRSFRYSPFRQRFATAVFIRNGYVVDEQAIDYVNRRYDFVINEPGQVLLALKCAQGQLLDVLAGTGTPEVSVIDTFSNLNMIWDEVRFVCHSTTALKVTLYQEIYDQCSDEYREKSPPPPPAPPPPNDTNTPIADISPPYEDDDVTSKNPIDEYFEPEPPEFPQGNRCDRYSVFVTCTTTTGSVFSDTSQFFGEIEYVGLNPTNLNSMIVVSHGLIISPGSTCSPTSQTTQVFGSSAGFDTSTFSYTITPI